MATQYQVKSGDTLSRIAQQLGVKQSDITGYRSNDPNRIFAGETLTIGGGSAPAATTTAGTTTGKDGYTSAISSLLGVSSKPSVDYSSLATTAKTNKEKAFNELQGYKTKAYEKEYSSRGLDRVFKDIQTLDDEIAAAKKSRDMGIAQSQKNPYASASTLAGDAGKIRTAENDRIGTLVEQRNSKASLYNDALQELDRVVGNAAKDKELAYTYWQNEESTANKMLSSVQDALIKELQQQQEWEREDARNTVKDSQWARELEIALMNARRAGSGGSADFQLITDPIWGKPIGTFNRRSAAYSPYQGTGDTSSGLTPGSTVVLPNGVTVSSQAASSGGGLGSMLKSAGSWLWSKL